MAASVGIAIEIGIGIAIGVRSRYRYRYRLRRRGRAGPAPIAPGVCSPGDGSRGDRYGAGRKDVRFPPGLSPFFLCGPLPPGGRVLPVSGYRAST